MRLRARLSQLFARSSLPTVLEDMVPRTLLDEEESGNGGTVCETGVVQVRDVAICDPRFRTPLPRGKTLAPARMVAKRAAAISEIAQDVVIASACQTIANSAHEAHTKWLLGEIDIHEYFQIKNHCDAALNYIESQLYCDL